MGQPRPPSYRCGMLFCILHSRRTFSRTCGKLRRRFRGSVELITRLRSYAVFALGDSSYGKYNWVGKKMSRRMDSLGATAVVQRGEGDDQNEWG